MIDVVVHRQLGEDVAGEELALRLHLFAAADFGHGFGRHFDRFDARFQPEARGFGDDRIADLVLEPRIGVDDVPARHV